MHGVGIDSACPISRGAASSASISTGTPCLDVLQHRRLDGAELAREHVALLRRSARSRQPMRCADVPRLAHHRFAIRIDQRVVEHAVDGRAGQRRHRVHGHVAPQLVPDVALDARRRPRRRSRRRRAAPTSVRTRSDSPPRGSPMIRRLPTALRVSPGSVAVHAACTTQPTTWRAGIAASMRPSGIDRFEAHACERRRRIHRKNHHGTPFIAVSTTVCGSEQRADAAATLASDGPLTATITRSCAPSSAARLATCAGARHRACRRFPGASHARRSASAVAPRAITETSHPAAASRVPMSPPMAPGADDADFHRR